MMILARCGIRLLGVFALTTLSGCWSGPPLPLATVDIERMYGSWYLVATVPNRGERGLVEPHIVLSPGANGDIQEDDSARRGGFDAPLKHLKVRDSIVPGTNNAHWRIHIFGPIQLPFLVTYVDPEYRFALFGENDRSIGWIYSRTQLLEEADYRQLLQHFAAVGYDPKIFRKSIQFPWQIGLPGYWSEGIKCPAERPACY